jgi:hypothetical protein
MRATLYRGKTNQSHADYKCEEKAMKRTKFLSGMLAMALVFGMAVVGCDSGGGGGGNAPDSVVGIWEAPATGAYSGSTLRVTFAATTVTQVLVSNGSVVATNFSNAPYTYSGGTVTITVGGETYTGKVSGTRGTFVVDGETIIFTKVQ